MNAISKNKGVSLLEIVVSLFIIGVICIAFLPLFSSGFKLILLSGQKNQMQYTAQQAIESKLSGVSSSSGNVTTTETASSLDIKFGDSYIIINGKTINSKCSNGNASISLTAFKPN